MLRLYSCDLVRLCGRFPGGVVNIVVSGIAMHNGYRNGSLDIPGLRSRILGGGFENETCANFKQHCLAPWYPVPFGALQASCHASASEGTASQSYKHCNDRLTQQPMACCALCLRFSSHRYSSFPEQGVDRSVCRMTF